MTQTNPQNFQRGTVASDEVGYLTVRVSTAGGAIPLERASVSVRSSDLSEENVIYSLRTNSDGLTPTVSPDRMKSGPADVQGRLRCRIMV